MTRSFWSRTSSNRLPPKVRGRGGPSFAQTTSANSRRFLPGQRVSLQNRGASSEATF
jgi:hypothetical protein